MYVETHIDTYMWKSMYMDLYMEIHGNTRILMKKKDLFLVGGMDQYLA